MKKYILLIGLVTLTGCSEKPPALTGWRLDFSNQCLSIIDDYYDVGDKFKVLETFPLETEHDKYFECRETFSRERANASEYDNQREIRDRYEDCEYEVSRDHRENPRELPTDHGPVTHQTIIRAKGLDEDGKYGIIGFMCSLNHPDATVEPDNFEKITIQTAEFVR